MTYRQIVMELTEILDRLCALEEAVKKEIPSFSYCVDGPFDRVRTELWDVRDRAKVEAFDEGPSAPEAKAHTEGE